MPTSSRQNRRRLTHPANLETFDSLLPPTESSSAAELATSLPSSQVIKAFNTVFAGTLSAKKVGPITTTVLEAGDSSNAKVALTEAVKAGGIEAIDAGGLNRARELEAMGFRPLKLAASEQVGWTGSF